LAQAIDETLSSFVEKHGSDDLDGFILVLGERLMQRGRPDTADALGRWTPVVPRQQ